MTNIIETAPERIWLQISDNDVDAAFPFPENTGDVTWCAESVVAVEVEYVRADLARQQRDKLLAALEKCRDMVGHPDNIAFIDAAIAEVKGPK